MWFKKTPLSPIELRFNLPADGTYPPRIFTLEKSIWLKGEAPIRLTPNVAIRREHNDWLFYSQSKSVKLLLNKHEVFQEHILHDGDFIHSGKFKGFFQADPVANFRKYVERNIEELPQSVSIIPTERMKKWIVMDGQGISLDGGQHTAKWDEVIYVEFGYDPHRLSKRRIKLFVFDQRGKPKKLPAKLDRINQEESTAISSWITYSTPFKLSVNNTNLRKNEPMQIALVVIGFVLTLILHESNPTGLNQETFERVINATLAVIGQIILTLLVAILYTWGIFGVLPFLVKRVLKLIVKNRQQPDDIN